MIVFFSYLWTKVKSPVWTVSLAIFNLLGVPECLQWATLRSIWFCTRFLDLLHLSFEWGKLICFKRMQQRCHLIKEPSIWRNIWAPNSGCSVTGTKLIVTCKTSELLIYFFKNLFCLVFFPQIGSIREKFPAKVSFSVKKSRKVQLYLR